MQNFRQCLIFNSLFWGNFCSKNLIIWLAYRNFSPQSGGNFNVHSPREAIQIFLNATSFLDLVEQSRDGHFVVSTGAGTFGTFKATS